MAANEEDDDYMGDLGRFLSIPDTASVATVGKVKGGTVDKRKMNWKEKKKLKQEKNHNLEEEQRQEGMAAVIPSSNIGFKLLQQMGYKPGNALGKHGQGVTEPINVDLKRNRTGLGRDEVVKEEKSQKSKQIILARERKRKKVDELRVGFQERRRGTWQSRKIVSDYRKACTALLQLEEQAAGTVTESARPVNEKTVEVQDAGKGVDKVKTEDAEAVEEDEEEEEEITEEMLHDHLTKLRGLYHYCLYCGFQYDSEEALIADCPGLEDEVH